MVNSPTSAENQEASLIEIVNFNEEKEVKPEKILFVGDMMFDRGVERLMLKTSFSYPMELIKDFLNGFDSVIGNLEGPINEEVEEFADGSMKFSFDKRILETLNEGNFSLLSLANNHTLNTNRPGLEETREILKESKINYLGDPIDCDIDYVFQKRE